MSIWDDLNNISYEEDEPGPELTWRKIDDLTEQFADKTLSTVGIETARYCIRLLQKIEVGRLYSLKEIKAICGELMWGHSRYLRRLWRAGLVRRFVRGRFTGRKDGGEWYGVHYLFEKDQTETVRPYSTEKGYHTAEIRRWRARKKEKKAANLSGNHKEV